MNSGLYRLFDAARNRLNRRLSSYFSSCLASVERARVMEAGSGPGYCASLIRRQANVIQTVALDIDTRVLRLAHNRDAGLSPVGGDLLRLPFPDACFDLVYNSSTLEHIRDYQLALGEMARVLKPGGCLFVGVPCRSGPLLPFTLLPRGSLSEWIGAFLPRDEILSCGRRLHLRPIEEGHYFFRFFHGFLFRKPNL